ANYRWNFMELCTLRGAPAALAGNQLIMARAQRPDDDRLDHAALRDRGGELVERLLGEVPARLVGVRLDVGDRQHGRPPRPRPPLGVAPASPRSLTSASSRRVSPSSAPRPRPSAGGLRFAGLAGAAAGGTEMRTTGSSVMRPSSVRAAGR